jgi:uncharacterized protein YecE (DUF72 family)
LVGLRIRRGVVSARPVRRDRLPYYAERFDAVEVNSTSYAVPAERQVERVREPLGQAVRA